MPGATDRVRRISCGRGWNAFWSNILHVQNYDYNTFVKELQQIGEHMSKQK